MNDICFHFLSVLLIKCFMISLAMNVRNLTTDQFALLEFKHHIIDPHNVLAINWTASGSICGWVGVSCGIKHGRVTSLNLPNMNLTGTIPPQLGNLSFLVYLNFSNNDFYGHLPKELGQLGRLRLFDLSFNHLSGEISSWLGNLHKVEKLRMGGNNFIGTIPPTLVNMSNLEILSLEFNQLSGPIPFSIFKVSSLKDIHLSDNNLSGSLPVDLCVHLPKLQCLYLQKNELSGYIPSSIGKCSNLLYLELHQNQFHGLIPRNIGNLTRLKEVCLGLNHLEGELPEEIGNLLSLEFLDAESMGLTGQIPASIFNISSLKKIYLLNNSLSGNLPPMTRAEKLERLILWRNNLTGNILNSITNASMLKSLDLGENSFSGLIPNTLGNLRHLERLQINYNYLTTEAVAHEWSFLSSLANCRNLTILAVSGNPLNGILPNYIGNLSISLRSFYASGCEFKGNIPSKVGNLSKMLILDLSDNRLSGSIPATIGRLRNLQGLDLMINELEGPIPQNIYGLERLYMLSLSSNKLYGPILTCLGNLTSLGYLYLDSNKLCSTIPSTMGNLKDILEIDLSSNYLSSSQSLDVGDLTALISLNLSRNLLTSVISSTFGGLENLVSLDLSYNKLYGHIPESFGGLISLGFLDLCNNNLSGVIPKSLEKLSDLKFLNLSFNRLEGEIPSGGRFRNFSSKSFMKNYALCGPPRLLVPPCKSSIHGHSKINKMGALRYALPIVASIIVIIVLIVAYKKCRNQGVDKPIKDDLLSVEMWRRISHAELLQATDGFSEHNLLGSGSFGSVYQGRLSDGMNVAIKVFNLQLEGAFRSFDIECALMSKILHRNLVKVITCCSNIDFKAVVLDFMPNGSLEKWLHSEDFFLDIIQRINIMIDVASALEYLHVGHPTPVVHCDLKPSNILLAEDMVAHVGDFGIAKLLGEGDFMKQTMTLATMGYMAQEYGLAGIVSVKCDIYSFGILLIETFTKKKPTDEIFTGAMTMRHWVKMSLSKGIIDIADALLLRREEEYFIVKANCISSILELALDCSAELPEERKDMKDVVVSLKKIKQKFLNSIEQTKVSKQH